MPSAGVFSRGPRKPELTEAQKTLDKKREELARVPAGLAHDLAQVLHVVAVRLAVLLGNSASRPLR